MHKTSKSNAAALALSMYAGEPCRICGLTIGGDEVQDAVFAGYSSDNVSRSAHGECWKVHGNDRSKWKHL